MSTRGTARRQSAAVTLVIAALGAPAIAQGPQAQGPEIQRLQAQGLQGSSERFAVLQPARSKTFVRASSDPDERPSAMYQGNDDGVTGVNHCEAYRTTSGGNDLAVLADVRGRAGFMGVFFRNYWSGLVGMPTFSEELNRSQIVIDGGLRHDMPLTDYFRNPDDPRGQIAPFRGPFTGNRAGGHLTHTPLRWFDSFRVQVVENAFDNAGRFHKVAGTLMAPERLATVPDLADWERVYERIGRWRHAVARTATNHDLSLEAAGGSSGIVLSGPGAILELRCRIDRPELWNHLVARFRFDGQRAASVDVPLRLLGGMLRRPFSQPLDTLMFGNDGEHELWTYFPMPFADRAELEFVNLGPTEVELGVTIARWHGDYPRPFGYFSAFYDHGVTQTGASFRGPRLSDVRGVLRALLLEDLVDTTGRIPGIFLDHLEGDLCIRVNGNRGDDHVFAATETSIGKWGWYGSPSDVAFVNDTSFNTGMLLRARPDRHLELIRMQGSTFVFDPIQFVDGIDIVLEHGVQNRSNAEYGLLSVCYLEPGAARELVFELDVGDPAAEAARSVGFTTAPGFQLTSPFFRDVFFNTPAWTDEGRELQSPYRFRVAAAALPTYRGICIGFRLDRPKIGTGSWCQARLFVDGTYAGLLHSSTSNALNRWKEGGELEVELPRALTDGKSSFVVEVRPVAGGDPLRVGTIFVYGYVKD